MKNDKVQHLRNVPNLRFGEFTDEYTLKYISDISSRITAGGTPSTKNPSYWLNGTVPWMSSGEVNKRILIDTDKYITEEGLSNSSTKMIQNKSVLMALAGQGKTRGMVAVNEIPLCTNQSIGVIELDNKYQDYKYLYYNLLREYKKLRIWSSTGEGRGGINLKFISDWKLNFPSLKEQKTVSQYLDLIDKKISLIGEKTKNLKLFKKGFAKKLFEDIIGKQKIALTDIYLVKTGTRNNQDKEMNGIYPFFVRSQNIEHINTYSYDEEAILIPGEGKIGDIYHYASGKFEVHQRVYKITSKSSDISIKFLYYYMEQYFKRHALSYSVKATVDSLRMIVFESFNIPILDMNSQKEITFKMEYLDMKVKHVSDNLETLKQFKKGLLQQMFI